MSRETESFPGACPTSRLRRLRGSASMRDMLAEPMPGPEKFIYPIFVCEGRDLKRAIASLPGQHRWSVDRLEEVASQVFGQGVRTVLLFGVPGAGAKSDAASAATAEDGLIPRAIRQLRRQVPELQLFTDVCLCAFTADGQCELPADSAAKRNDSTLAALAKMARCHARAGADCVAPSAMMDGQVRAIRDALDADGFSDRLLMSYSTKFASAMYGPFREAADSTPGVGDRRGYQADYRNLRAALRESYQDAAEGADILMVKPALFYLDVMRELRDNTRLPLAAYNVSGEYGMLLAAAEKGCGDLKAMVRESIHALARAGADIIISYWALRYRELLA